MRGACGYIPFTYIQHFLGKKLSTKFPRLYARGDSMSKKRLLLVAVIILVGLTLCIASVRAGDSGGGGAHTMIRALF